MSTRPLSNPHGYNGLKMARNAHQGRQEGETMEAFKVRRARGVLVSIQARMAEERELLGLCGPGDIVKGMARRQWRALREAYKKRLAMARPLLNILPSGPPRAGLVGTTNWRLTMQLKQFDTRTEAYDMARRCSTQAIYHRQAGEFAIAATFEGCVMALNRQIDRMDNNLSLAVYEFHCWSGKASAESNAERAARQNHKAWARVNRQARQNLSNWQGIIGRQCIVTIKKGN